MKLSAVATLLTALAAVAFANPVTRSHKHVVHEERHPARSEWAKNHRLHTMARLPVRIGLAQSNLHRANEFMNNVAHPDSPNYGRHWTHDEIINMFAPRQESIALVMQWLESEGIQRSRIELSKGRNWVQFNGTVGEVERLLKTEYHVYKHEQGHMHIACDKYHVPEHLVEHIDMITPSVHFDQRIGAQRKNTHHDLEEHHVEELKKRQLKKRAFLAEQGAVAVTATGGKSAAIQGSPDSGFGPKQGAVVMNALMNLEQCDAMITPDCLRALYATPPGSLKSSNNTLGIVEYTPQAFLQTDLDMYFNEFEPRLKGATPIVSLVGNAVVQTQNQSFRFNGESALDLQFAMALIFPQQTTLYQVGDLNQGASFNNFLDAIDGSYCTFQGGGSKDPNIDGQYGPKVCGSAPLVNVISTSYGFNEADLGRKYVERQCAEYMKLGLQGVTVLYSSGDSGVAGNGQQCIDTQTGAYNEGKTGIFNPSFPGGCPWVTSVGATQVLEGSTVHTPESACQKAIFSGGGFSNIFAVPDYQKKTMDEYYATNAPPYGADRYNNSRTVRGFPDISANGANYVTAVNGKFSLSFGTSASAPVVGSIINLVNEKRIEAGKKPVGFINPTLYAHPEILNDVTNGDNPGCGTKGFSAVQGWDPVTGMGTPNYPEMEKLFMSLP
ncbi:Putative peptidase S53, activation domain, Sedolisin domain, peptidase S8/S53 domain superfamily [Colletotrichum destructivum]|uniref:tripeptidyl-peptidase II n=1 Tax=Colletotrichum destructivum TaxID=34406 RepID=A0AAX4IHT2_9PEZI|nr:Putative peptidase S53, activation domain, Sedolisin domain, peptidase S8/S53 domain superfamily [Colletotrichum destructivum]